ncbi:hypothetical protein F4859DRAFT_509506 [Xylaria cf. heliscus]|nr:hypothetical protein F4859DRAFT_509506 [Xylaria cf. heliscus]
MEAPPLGLVSLNWPLADVARHRLRGTFINGHGDFAPGKIIEKDLIPVEFASKLLSESFWNDPDIPRKTDNFFHRTRLFISRTPYVANDSINAYANPMVINQSLSSSNLTQSEKVMIKEWGEREALWNTLRGSWYQVNYELWQETPWSITYMRSMLSAFQEGHQKADIEQCSACAENLVSRIPWYPITTREAYIADLEALGYPWIIHCIGLLMMAAIPIRNHGEFSPLVSMYRGEHWTPSKEAQKAGRQSMDVQVQIKTQAGGTPLPPSRFPNPLRPGFVLTAADCTQFHFLDMVLEIIQYLALAQTLVPTTWIAEILRVEGLLRKELMDRRQSAFSFEGMNTWSLSWDFEVPEFRPDLLSMWVNDQWTPI